MRLRFLVKCVTGVCTAGVFAAAVSSMSVASAAPRTSPAGNGHFSFALIGDMPYGPEGDQKFPNILAEINADRTLSFVVHDGDVKNGSSLCSDEVFHNRLDLFNSFVHPFIYIPGDNEWTAVTARTTAATIHSSGWPCYARCSSRPTKASG